MNYTKGEWKKQNVSGDDVHIVSDAFVGIIAKVNQDCYSVNENAHLISAAPEMYEALKKIIDNTYIEYADLKELAEKALNKAEGK
jgi:hypothetical protein